MVVFLFVAVGLVRGVVVRVGEWDLAGHPVLIDVTEVLVLQAHCEDEISTFDIAGERESTYGSSIANGGELQA